MRVYRESTQEFATNALFPLYKNDGVWYDSNESGKKQCILQPAVGVIVHTGTEEEFDTLTTLTGVSIQHDKYYKLVSVNDSGYAVWEESENGREAIFDIMECQYNGQDMGKRSVVATIQWDSPIAFHIGDYIDVPMQSLLRGNGKAGTVIYERFYIYTEPQCKKTARAMSAGDAFEHTVTFYPRQYELGAIQMRDFVQADANADNIFYTGFDEVTFYGGAHELLERCMACMEQQYIGNDGQPLWRYVLADAVNEDVNTALERYAFSFSQQSIMDALLKLNDKEGINTTFFINDRTIYVGFKRPYFCKVDDAGNIQDTPLRMMYGKTSHEPISHPSGGLYDITKSVSEEMPITRLYAYGASRNLNRYYCSDRIKSGRFVNKLMLPTFSDDGRTDYIESEDGKKKYGIVEGSHTFEEIYPSLRYMTYADIRGIKYCIKVKASGLNADIWSDGKMEHLNSSSTYPIARVQCFRVDPVMENGSPTGVNTLTPAYPPEPLAVYIHAQGKTIKTILYTSLAEQQSHDTKVPTTDGSTGYILGACFCVHDPAFDDDTTSTRSNWFSYTAGEEDNDKYMHRIEYVDTFWLTDLYVFTGYHQTSFLRDGYSAWAWPRLNGYSKYPDSWLVNEVVAVEPIVIADTSDNADGGRQQHWDIYLRDIGFAPDEQNDFGEMVFVFSTPVVSVLDGILTGREFTIDGGDNLNDYQDRVVCAYNEDGSLNDEFMSPGDSGDINIPSKALLDGAIWRIRLNRNGDDSELSSIGLIVPSTDLYMKAGDHIVLLDIYMPDIYVRAAENRLMREALKYLDKNDKGNIKYAISFDKVRIQQIPNYALQMREGVLLRVVDEDLNMTSDNAIRSLLDYNTPVAYDVALFENVSEIEDEITESRYTYKDEYRNGAKIDNFFYNKIISHDATTHKIKVSVPRTTVFSEFGGEEVSGTNKHKGITFNAMGEDFVHYKEDVTVTVGTDFYLLEFIGKGNDEHEYQALSAQVRVVALVSETSPVTKSHEEPIVGPVYAICKDFIEFKSNKWYEVTVDTEDALFADFSEDEEVTYDNSVYKRIALSTGFEDAITRFDGMTVTEKKLTGAAEGYTRRKFTFYLENSFNDAVLYYFAAKYYVDNESSESDADDRNDYGYIKMVSILEKDLDEDNKKVDYVDFLVSSVNIKITDNTRPDDTRILGVYPEPIREITAQITEQSKASTWAQLMQNVEKNALEIDQTQHTYEMLVQNARNNYQRLLALRDSIFDPDGTCNETFLQVMMLQVGADSMNYHLRKTYMDAGGEKHNFTVAQKGGSGNYYFSVLDNDYLDHYVYTQGGQAGTWYIPGFFEKELVQVDGAYPTYFVCIKCLKNADNPGTAVVWVCETTQHAVNEDNDYWYFNFGILTYQSGVYVFSETRGNAYMYGDNIIAGKISDIAKRSYFDLTQGNFVLSNGTTQALSYVNGVLTIGALSEASGIGKTIHDLGLDVDALEAQEIGGENLYGGEDPLTNSTGSSSPSYTGVVLKSGKKYVVLVGQITTTHIACIVKAVVKNGSSYTEKGTLSAGTPLVITGTGTEFGFRAKCPAPGQSATLTTIMVQKGTKPTSYNTYYTHLTNALKGSTEAAGGLVMTNLLMLKNNATPAQVVAGMSGLTENGENVLIWGGGTYAQALNASEHNYYKEGSSGQKIKFLIKKDGTGKIGCFQVEDADSVSVIDEAGNTVIISTKSIEDYTGSTQTKVVSITNSQTIDIGTYNVTIAQGSIQYTCTSEGRSPQSSVITEDTKCIFEVYVYLNIGGQRTLLGTASIEHSHNSATYETITSTLTVTIPQDAFQKVLNESETASIETATWMEMSGDIQSKSMSRGSISGSTATFVKVLKQTIIGKDGFCVMIDTNTVFKVKNNANALTVIAKGLPNSASDDGQLYEDENHFLKVG